MQIQAVNISRPGLTGYLWRQVPIQAGALKREADIPESSDVFLVESDMAGLFRIQANLIFVKVPNGFHVKW